MQHVFISFKSSVFFLTLEYVSNLGLFTFPQEIVVSILLILMEQDLDFTLAHLQKYKYLHHPVYTVYSAWSAQMKVAARITKTTRWLTVSYIEIYYKKLD